MLLSWGPLPRPIEICLQDSGIVDSFVIHVSDLMMNSGHRQHKALAKSLFNQICETLNLIEVDYFGLEYVDSNGTRVLIERT